jgi:hypothetical protein
VHPKYAFIKEASYFGLYFSVCPYKNFSFLSSIFQICTSRYYNSLFIKRRSLRRSLYVGLRYSKTHVYLIYLLFLLWKRFLSQAIETRILSLCQRCGSCAPNNGYTEIWHYLFSLSTPSTFQHFALFLTILINSEPSFQWSNGPYKVITPSVRYIPLCTEYCVND